MNVGCNYLREHMAPDCRLHYAIIDAGGIAPNVVQRKAMVRYSIRAGDVATMRDLFARVQDVARGAALMTGTSVEIKVISAVSNLMGNTPLETAMWEVLDRLGPPEFDDADRAFARQIQATLTPEDIETAYHHVGLEPQDDKPLCDLIVPRDAPGERMFGSTDVSDVSWVVPLAQVHGATCAIGTPFHSWQLVAQGKSALAKKGMVHAATVIAETARRVFTDPELIAAAKADLARRTAKSPYVSPLPEGTRPPIAEMAQPA